MAKPGQEPKTIFITGAGSGIGRVTAQLFSERGWFVAVSDIDQAGLEETAASLAEGRRLSLLLDVRDRAAWTRAMRAVGEATGRKLHVLFNNAGIGAGGWFEDVAPDETEQIIDVNIKGALNGVYAALDLLRETPGSRIVNVASVAALHGIPRMAAYSASKAALRALTEALDLEFERHGVRVVSLSPWFIDTPLLDSRGSGHNQSLRDAVNAHKSPIYPARLCAERAWEAAHGSQLHYFVGKEAERASVATRLFPRRLRAQLRKIVEG